MKGFDKAGRAALGAGILKLILERLHELELKTKSVRRSKHTPSRL